MFGKIGTFGAFSGILESNLIGFASGSFFSSITKLSKPPQSSEPENKSKLLPINSFGSMLGLFVKKQNGESKPPEATSLQRMAIRLSYLIPVFCLLASCAVQGTLTGGGRDETPPRLDSSHSTPNFQTHFQKQTIVLAFNEWVELKDVFNQVVISPPLAKRPTIERKKKTIQLAFDENEVLRDSATYVINFGQAIRDLTEGNPAPIVFVFSTGDYIDSLSVSGEVVDAPTGKPSENVLFMLYENMADSVVRTERPFYFARTDKAGKFTVSNVKEGAFKAVALLDPNLNYHFDGESEKIAFLDSALVIKAPLPPVRDTIAADTLSPLPTTAPDSLAADILAQPLPPMKDTLAADTLAPQHLPGSNVAPSGAAPKMVLRLFEEEKTLFAGAKETNVYGRVKLGFNREPYDAIITFDSVGQTTYREQVKDTIVLWYHLPADTAWQVYIRRDTTTDTVRVNGGLRAAFLQNNVLAADSLPASPAGKHHPARSLPIRFGHPIDSFDVSKILLLEDTAKVQVRPSVRIDSLDRRTLQIAYPWKEDTPYEAQLLPGSVTDIFGLTTADTLSRTITTGLHRDYGTLTMRLTNLDPEKGYFVKVLGSSGTLLASWQVRDKAVFETTLAAINPGTYNLEVVEDLDGNGRWTTGDYDLHRQPERIFRSTLDEMRANWELDAEVEVVFE
jgi:Big-like domain-containing protein